LKIPTNSTDNTSSNSYWIRFLTRWSRNHGFPFDSATNLNGPFDQLEDYDAWVAEMADGDNPLFFAIVDRERGTAAGVASYLRIDRHNETIEVGHLQYSPLFTRTRAATEAMYLMMARGFDDLGYRRYEWTCDSLNEPSRSTALRLGFIYESQFRQTVFYRGRNRDNDWFSITDGEWPELKASFEAWLDPANFTEDGTQRTELHAALGVRER